LPGAHVIFCSFCLWQNVYIVAYTLKILASSSSFELVVQTTAWPH